MTQKGALLVKTNEERLMTKEKATAVSAIALVVIIALLFG
jgi:hypothetical protein